MTLIHVPNEIFAGKNLINGEWVDTHPVATMDVKSPYTGGVIGRIAVPSISQIDTAISAAARAASHWRTVPIKERTQLLYRFRHLMLENLEQLANSAALEAGKTKEEAKAGVLKGVEVIEFALSLQNFEDGSLEVSRGVTCEIKREPLGVVAGIVPFNFPAMVPLWMFPIAITLGNAFILKPSEKVPITSCRMGQLMIEAGFPPGVFSILHGGRETASALVDHPGISAIGFVGSTTAARAIYAQATQHGKRALCLGGAKNQLICVPDADPNVTIKGVVDSFTGCAGQRCMAASLLLAIGDVDSLISQIAERAASFRLGQDMGAIIDRAAYDRIRKAIGDAERDGARLVLDGRKVPPPLGYEEGNWIAPTILDFATPHMGCSTTEIFGPVLTIVRLKTLEEALAIENRAQYGNATSIFTTNPAIARYVTGRATSGMIGINIGVPVPREPFSFGGTKDSKFGHGDITGKSSVEFWTSLKKITSKWELQSDANWMA